MNGNEFIGYRCLLRNQLGSKLGNLERMYFLHVALQLIHEHQWLVIISGCQTKKQNDHKTFPSIRDVEY